MIKPTEGMYSSLLQMKMELFRLKNRKKGRAIVEIDTDGCYVMSEKSVKESTKVKMFDKFIEDLKQNSARDNG